MFGNKRLLEEKDKRIAELHAQIARLESLIPQFQKPSNPLHIPVLSVESDAVMTGHQDQIQLTAAQIKELDALESEATKILTGNYD